MPRAKQIPFEITAKDKSAAAVLSFKKGMSGMKTAALGVAGVVGVGGALVGGFAALTNKAIKTADAIAKTADAIGITTGTLQEYTFAGGLAGIETEKMGVSLKKFSKTFGELRANTGAAVTFLKLYDKELLENLQKTERTDDALNLVFRAMAKVTNQSDKAALSAAFFGRAGTDLTRIVKDGSDAFDEQRQRARDLGLVLEDDLLRGAEKANDQISILAQTIGTNFDRALLQAAPSLGNLAERLTESIPTLIEWVDQFGQFIGLIEMANVDRLKEVNDEIDRIEGLTDSFLFKAGQVLGGDDRLVKQLEALQREKASIEAIINGEPTSGAFDPAETKTPAPSPVSTRAPSKSAATAAAERKQALEEEKILTAALVKEMNEWLKAEEATAERRAEANEKIREQNASVKDHLAAMKEENNLLQLTLEGRHEEVAVLREQYALRDQIGRELLPAEKAELEKLTLAQKELNEQIDQSGENWQSFADLGTGAIQSLEDGFEGLAKFALNNLDQIISKLLEMNSISGGGGLFETIAGAFSGGFGGGSSYGAGTSVAAGSFDYIPAYAEGGSFRVGGRGGRDNNLVQFRASADETVTVETPAQQRRKAASINGGISVTNVFHIDNTGADPAAIQRMEISLQRAVNSIPQRSVAAVSDAIARKKMPGVKVA